MRIFSYPPKYGAVPFSENAPHCGAKWPGRAAKRCGPLSCPIIERPFLPEKGPGIRFGVSFPTPENYVQREKSPSPTIAQHGVLSSWRCTFPTLYPKAAHEALQGLKTGRRGDGRSGGIILERKKQLFMKTTASVRGMCYNGFTSSGGEW